ncbi:MAG: hydrogenase expression/formation protein HypE [Phycisphaerae bacterium]|nr:hydrogenase expression/formation protein HypE [Phycisphaerae bacterium]
MKDESKPILLAHGGGGRLTAELVDRMILPKFRNDTLSKLTDAAQLELESTSVSFTTDSFVVQPLEFPGGDIGKLAVCGTVNDLVVSGTRPVALSLGLIIEEGFDQNRLDTILASAAEAARQANVSIVAGDTKVVEKGAADGLFINTSGIGVRMKGANVGFDRIKPGDGILINGTLGDHGMTIMSLRKGIQFDSPIQSDCAVLSDLIGRLVDRLGEQIHFMRDPTRGGLAATLNEIVTATGLDLLIEETALPIQPTVQAAADMLGFDLLNIANEGKVVAVVAPDAVDRAMKIFRDHSLGRQAACVGRVNPRTEGAPNGLVEMVTRIGGRRIVQMPYGRDLPRIC